MDTLNAYQDKRLRTVSASQRAGAVAMYTEATRMAERAAEMMERAEFARAVAYAGSGTLRARLVTR